MQAMTSHSVLSRLICICARLVKQNIGKLTDLQVSVVQVTSEIVLHKLGQFLF